MESLPPRPDEENAALLSAVRLSFAAGVVLLGIKVAAAWWSGSVAVFSDAAESVAHVIAVGFAWFSLRLSLKPADETHPYGHAKIAYFSSAFEGGIILAAALWVIYQASADLVGEPSLSRPDIGLWFTALVTALNGALGWHLLRLGKRRNSIVLEANGHHVLTDCYTSFGVAAGLVLAWLTGWKKWDAICAIAVAGNMIWAARSLLSRSIHGLMDHADPALRSRLEEILARSCGARGVAFHALRFRSLGDALWADVHLTLPGKTLLRDAHAKATEIEREVNEAFGPSVYLTTHLESAEDHEEIHGEEVP